MENIKSVTPAEEKKSFLSELRKNPEKPLKILQVLLLAIPLLCISFIIAYFVCLNYMGDGAYKYSDETYEQIKTAIQDCVLEDIGLDSIGLQEKLNAIRNEKIASTPKAQREKPSGKVTARFDHIFENNQSLLICSIKDGFCETKITSVLSESYRIAKSERNFNSREEYMDYFWQVFGFSVLVLTVVLFIAIGLLVFGGLTIYGKAYNRQANKKQQKAEEDGTPSGTEFTEVNVVDVPSLESSESAQEGDFKEKDASDFEVHGVEETSIVKLADKEETETDKLPDAS